MNWTWFRDQCLPKSHVFWSIHPLGILQPTQTENERNRHAGTQSTYDMYEKQAKARNWFYQKDLAWYPEDTVLKHISKKITQLSTAKPFGPEKCPVYLRAPWIGSASQQLEHPIKSAVQNCYEAVSPRLIFSSQCMLPKGMCYLPIKEVWLFMNKCSTVIVVVVVLPGCFRGMAASYVQRGHKRITHSTKVLLA